jgi:hypothetical protein
MSIGSKVSIRGARIGRKGDQKKQESSKSETQKGRNGGGKWGRI